MNGNRLASRRARRRDHGSTMVEMLIAIVIVGTVVTGAMATLRATIISGTINRDHANAHAWLQSASDLVHQERAVDDHERDRRRRRHRPDRGRVGPRGRLTPGVGVGAGQPTLVPTIHQDPVKVVPDESPQALLKPMNWS